MSSIEKRLEALEARNARVEADKAWETSACRVLTICAITYIFIAGFLWLIHVPNFALAALVPCVGFFLSTRTLPFIKKMWLNHLR